MNASDRDLDFVLITGAGASCLLGVGGKTIPMMCCSPDFTQPDPDGDGPLARPETNYEYYTDGDQANLLKSITDPRALTTDIEYDFSRHVSQITERCGGKAATGCPSHGMVKCCPPVAAMTQETG